MAAVCRSTCGETRFCSKEGQFFRAMTACLVTRYWTESELKRAATCAGEQDLGIVLSLFLDPRGEHTHRWLCQRCASLLPSFSLTADVRTRTERDVALSKGW